MLIGTGTLFAGVTTVLLSLWATPLSASSSGPPWPESASAPAFRAASAFVALAHPDQRAGLLSVLFTVSYFGLGIPAVVAGVAVCAAAAS